MQFDVKKYLSKQVSEWQLGYNSNDSRKIDLDTLKMAKNNVMALCEIPS